MSIKGLNDFWVPLSHHLTLYCEYELFVSAYLKAKISMSKFKSTNFKVVVRHAVSKMKQYLLEQMHK